MVATKEIKRFRDADGLKLFEVLDKDQSDAATRARSLSSDDALHVACRMVHTEKRATKTDRAFISRRALVQALEDGSKAGRQGLASRQISIPLPALVVNGTVSVGLWIPAKKTVITSIAVAYLTVPSSALGTVVLDVNKVSGGVTTLVQATAAFDLEVLVAAVSSKIDLKAKDVRTLQAGDFLYAVITSDNADAVDGTAGVIVVTYNSF